MIERFRLYTLVDVSMTGTIGQYKPILKTNLLGEVLSNEIQWKKSRNQQRNYETFIQIVGLRAQPTDLSKSNCLLDQDLSRYQFGEAYKGIGTVYTITFDVDRENVYTLDGVPLAGLVHDFDNVPIITGLNETFSFKKSTFFTKNELKNVYFVNLNSTT